MEKVKLIEKKVKFSSLDQIVRLQLVLHCFAKDVHLTKGDYSLLTHIAIKGYDKKKTPADLVSSKIFLHKQSVRNTKNKLIKEGFLIETSDNQYLINPELQIESSGNVMIDFKAVNL